MRSLQHLPFFIKATNLTPSYTGAHSVLFVYFTVFYLINKVKKNVYFILFVNPTLLF